MKLTYLGHSCFKLEDQGYTVVFDPYEDGSVPGYSDIREKADLVLCSHTHRDHGAEDLIEKIQGGVSPFRIIEIPVWHDDARGTLRGSNVIRIVDNGRFRIAHFGDLGHDLTGEQQALLKDLDAVLIPVGGFYTIDAETAKKIVDEISPKTVIPMHFRGDGFGYDVIGPVEDFLSLCGESVRSESSTVEITEDTPAGVLVLKARNLK